MTLDDLKRDAKLAEEITPAGLPTADVLAPKNILLTGATGFLGAFLLHRLLRQTDAAIKCLVRANDESDAIVRLRKNLNRYNLWDEDLAARIVAIPGDLTHKRLGLSEKGYDRLAASIDIIYHNGAMVNFVYPYQAHKGANIVGTNEILRLATTKKLKAVHLVSTLSVLHTGDHDDGTVHDENVDLEENGVPFGGYAQSKWVAEKLALAAGERGVPIAIYRPGLISGDSNSGITNTADLIFNLSRACLLLGAAPDLEAMVDVVPVDYVSEAIIHLSLQQSSFGKTFHLANTQRWNYRQMVAWLQEEGFPLEMLPYETWRDRLIALARQLDAGEWAPFLPLLEEANADQIYMPDFDCQNVLDGLAETEIDCPPVGPELFGRYLRFFASQSFMLDGAIG